MKKNSNKDSPPPPSASLHLMTLRRKAEEHLRLQNERLGALSKKDIEKLVHELGTYQIELEMQNEELKFTQEELEKSRSQYVNLYDFAPVGYYTFDKNGVILDVNLAGAALLWKEKTFLIHKPFSLFIHKDDQDTFFLHRRKVFETDLRQTCEIRLKSNSSSEIYARVESIPDRDVHGNLTRIRSALSNITDIKLAEKRMNHLASFPHLNPNPVMETDSSGEITYFNPAIQTILEDIGLDNNDVNVFLPDDFEDILRKLEKKKETFYREIIIKDRIYSSTIHYAPQFNVVRIYAHDITGRKKVEAANLLAREEWERTFNSVPDLIAILDREHRIVRANRAMAERLGTSADQCAGLKCFACVHGTSVPPEACPHTLTMEDGREHTTELREDRLDGDFLVTTTPMFDETGRLTGSVHVARNITERKRAEKALRSAFARYRSFIAVTGQIGWTTNPAGEAVEDLPEWRNYTGQSFDDMKGWGWTKAIHPDDLAGTTAEWEKSVRERTGYEVEYRIRRHDGNYRLFMVRGTPVFKENGDISEWVGTCVDITERKLSEDKLRRTLDELRQRQSEISALLEASRAVIEQHDFKETARSIFDSCKKIIGATAGYVALLSKDGMENEVIFLDPGGLPCTVDPSLPMPVRGLRSVAYRTGRAVYENNFPASEWTEFMPDGHAALDNVMFAPMIIAGKVTGLLGLANKPGGFNNNDTRMAAAFAEFAAIALHNSSLYEALKNNEEKFRSVVKTASDTIITFDGSGHIIFWNRGVEDLFGYSDAEVKGMKLNSVMPEQFRDGPRDGMEREGPAGVQDIIGKRIETTGRKKDGSKFPIELSLAKWSSGDKVFFTGIIRDITGRKRAENQIRTSLEEKEVLLREVHHRVKNNMTVIFSLLKLQSRHVKDDRDRGLFEDSMARIKSMALIHEKLYRSKNMAEVDFGNYIKELAGSIFMSYRIPSGRIRLKTDVDNVSFGIDTAIPCGLIVNELLSNSMKYAFPEGTSGELRISLHEISGPGPGDAGLHPVSEIELIVGDNGTGMPEKIDISTSDSLGLTLVNAFVKQLQGTIEVSRENGTEFRIRFNK